MNYSDAYYHLMLMQVRFDDNYDAWLNTYLEKEDPLSDIVLELSLCISDLNKTISCLKAYCSGKPVDEKTVAERLRLFLKESYNSGRMSKSEVVSAMYRLATNHAYPYEFDTDTWGDMYYLEDYYNLAEDGIIPWDNFDRIFSAYLNEGTPLDSEKLWGLSAEKPKLKFKNIIAYLLGKK